MMLSIPFAFKAFSQSLRELKGNDCLLTEDPNTEELQEAIRVRRSLGEPW